MVEDRVVVGLSSGEYGGGEGWVVEVGTGGDILRG